MKNKEFDCVEMKHHAAANIQKKLKGMSLSEKLSFWRERQKVMNQRKRKILKKTV